MYLLRLASELLQAKRTSLSEQGGLLIPEFVRDAIAHPHPTHGPYRVITNSDVNPTMLASVYYYLTTYGVIAHRPGDKFLSSRRAFHDVALSLKPHSAFDPRESITPRPDMDRWP